MSEAKQTALQKALESGNIDAERKAVEIFRDKGTPNSMPNLIALLHRTQDEQLVLAITQLLSEMKNQVCVAPVIEAINNNAYKSIRKVLVASCWQNGLKYGGHLTSFLNVFVNEGFELAFDAFTVIEEHVEEFPVAEKQSGITMLKDKLNEMGSEKKTLALEMVHMLE